MCNRFQAISLCAMFITEVEWAEGRIVTMLSYTLSVFRDPRTT